MPVRPAPDAKSLRADALLAGALALVGCLMVALSTMTGLQPIEAPIWQPMLASVLLPAPLLVRRRWPIAVAVTQLVVYMAATELQVLELYASQVALFMGFYSIGAWHADRRRANRWRVALVLVLVAWFASAAVRGFFDPETGERGVSAYFALLIIQILINVGYFGAAWVFGDRAWASAVEQQRLVAAHEEIAAQHEQLAEQAVSLERVRIARELHDVVAHHVSAMGVQAGAARRMLTVDPDKAADALRHVEQSARDAIAELRSLVVTLRSDDDAAGSTPDLDALASLMADATASGQHVTFSEIGDRRPASSMLSLTAYRVVQEALTNARKHAGAVARVDVRLRWLPDELEVEVADDGHSGSATPGAGAGLVGMRERVTALGGTLEVGPRPRGGWLVRARMPALAKAVSGA